MDLKSKMSPEEFLEGKGIHHSESVRLVDSMYNVHSITALMSQYAKELVKEKKVYLCDNCAHDPCRAVRVNNNAKLTICKSHIIK